MPNNEMFIDNKIFTDIVNNIGTSADECILSGDALDEVKIWRDTDVGKKMEQILGKVYLATDEYRILSSMTLTTAYFKIRDSINKVDDTLSKSVSVG